jgi:hypothetical protein
MVSQQLEQLARDAKAGDIGARNQIVLLCQDTIGRAASRVAKQTCETLLEEFWAQGNLILIENIRDFLDRPEKLHSIVFLRVYSRLVDYAVTYLHKLHINRWAHSNIDLRYKIESIYTVDRAGVEFVRDIPDRPENIPVSYCGCDLHRVAQRSLKGIDLKVFNMRFGVYPYRGFKSNGDIARALNISIIKVSSSLSHSFVILKKLPTKPSQTISREISCKQCNVHFIPKFSGTKFCSKACKYENLRVVREKKCAHCNNLFRARRAHIKFCSLECYHKNSRKSAG